MLLSEAAVAEATEVLKAEDFYRGGHGEIFAAMLELYQALGARRPGLGLRPARPARLARAGRRPPGRVRAGRGRPGRHERAALRRDRARDGASCAGSSGSAPRSRSSATTGPGDTRELLDMAEQKVYEIAQNGTSEDFTLIKQPLDEAFHRLTLLFEHGDGTRRDRAPDGLRRARPADLGPAEVEPRDPGRAPVDGQDEPRAQHRRARRR